MRTLTNLLVGLGMLSLSALPSCGPPPAESIGGEFEASLRKGFEEGDQSFDHSLWDGLLSRHVDENAGRLDYRAVNEERETLTRYLDLLGRADTTTLGKGEQKALFINAYNAYTVERILNHYGEIESIKDIDQPWSLPSSRVAGETLSLDAIEHNLLRPLFRDPRIHFAINCASISCPPLRAFAYTGSKIDEQLEEVTRATLRDPRYVELVDGRVLVTKVLHWFEDDFKGDGQNVATFLARYVEDEVREVLENQGVAAISYLDYDWKLNDRR